MCPLQIATQMNDGSSSEFMAIIKFGAESGRMFRIDQIGGSAGYENVPTELLPGTRLVFDFGSISEGWIFLAAGTPPSLALVPAGQPLPPRPTKEHRQGVRVLVHLGKAGGVREFMSASKSVTSAIADLYLQFEAAQEAAMGKVPIVDFQGATMHVQKNKYGTKQLYTPRFAISGWVERLPEFGARTVPPPGAARPAANTPSPTPVNPPQGGNGAAARITTARTPPADGAAIGRVVDAALATKGVAASDDWSSLAPAQTAARAPSSGAPPLNDDEIPF